MKLNIILGDQLDSESSLFVKLDKTDDVICMAEVEEESTHVWSHKQRIALFLSAMRHFRQKLIDNGFKIEYFQIYSHQFLSLAECLTESIKKHQPDCVRVVRPGDYRVLSQIKSCCEKNKVQLVILNDDHFLSSPSEFKQWSQNKKQLRLEYWYRYLRKKHKILLDEDGAPQGGSWNFDRNNRKSFGKDGPKNLPKDPPVFEMDDITKRVVELVNNRFTDHPGELYTLNWPVTSEQAEQALDYFLQNNLNHFGDFQDAMWTNEAFLYHSLLSSSLNLKLIHPLKVIKAAENAYHKEHAPIAAVEGFIRQILGWREYVRCLYWRYMPDWLEMNALQADEDLPEFFWNAETSMDCLKQTIQQTLKYGYAHHIQRLMVTGVFSLIYGVKPKAIHEWYLAVYVDAVEWVELPNTIGMSQYADDGLMASKPYIASGQYINRMSNYCKSCQYKPDQSVGEDACPFTTFYWEFLIKHRNKFAGHQRMNFMLKNLERKDDEEIEAIKEQALQTRKAIIKAGKLV